MEINRKSISLFVLTLGVVAYLAGALWSAFFIVVLPSNPDAIVDSIQLQTGVNEFEFQPVKFSNRLQEMIYYHNLSMLDRYRYWEYVARILGALIGMLVFYQIPNWKTKLDSDRKAQGIFVGIVFGVLAVIIIPFILGKILPAPYKWFPEAITHIADLQEKEAMNILKERAYEETQREY